MLLVSTLCSSQEAASGHCSFRRSVKAAELGEGNAKPSENITL